MAIHIICDSIVLLLWQFDFHKFLASLSKENHTISIFYYYKIPMEMSLYMLHVCLVVKEPKGVRFYLQCKKSRGVTRSGRVAPKDFWWLFMSISMKTREKYDVKNWISAFSISFYIFGGCRIYWIQRKCFLPLIFLAPFSQHWKQ